MRGMGAHVSPPEGGFRLRYPVLAPMHAALNPPLECVRSWGGDRLLKCSAMERVQGPGALCCMTGTCTSLWKLGEQAQPDWFTCSCTAQ